MSRTKRGLSYLSAVVVGFSLVSVAATPAFAVYGTLAPSTWAYVDSQTPKTLFVNPAGDARIGTIVDSGHTSHTYRSYFTFDLTQMRGVAVHMANFFSRESTVTDCNATAPVELWQTRPVKNNSTWKNPPAELKLIQAYQLGRGASCPGYLGADLAPVVTAALARHETSLTVELRIAAANETDPALGRYAVQPGMGTQTNHVPTVTDVGLVGQPCGTLAKHPTAGNSAHLTAKLADGDPSDHPSGSFAIWPQEHPDQRREFTGAGGGTQPTMEVRLTDYPEGTVVAYQAQADDRLDTSPWSKTCYLTIDRTAPAHAPAVASSLYREGTTAYGGQGVKGKFRFDAEGDADVVAFAYSNGFDVSATVQARRPGGSAVIDYAPKLSGSQELAVTAIDGAGNRGPTRHYGFVVQNTAPFGSVDVAGVGLTSRITLSSYTPNVTALSYQLPGADEVKFAATNGTATHDIVFPTAGYIAITTRSYVKNKMVGTDTLYVNVSDAPRVESTDFTLEQDVVVGKSGAFTFKPGATDVVAYSYDFGNGPQRIDANADGSAVLSWTANQPGWTILTVQSERSDGSQTMATYYQFNVIDDHPTAYAGELQGYPRRDGAGLPLDVQLTSWLPNATGFAYRLNGGAEQTVGGGPYAYVTVVPPHAGDNTLALQALLSDGTRSRETVYTFSIFSGPIVTQAPAGEGTVAKPISFTLHPGLPDVSQYRYTLPGGEEQTIAAGTDGTATIGFTPTDWGYFELAVTSVGSDGTPSETRGYPFTVRDNQVSVYSSYNTYWALGGIGKVAYFQFNTQLFGEVTQYRYHVNNGPEQTVLASTEGAGTSITVTLDRNGLNTIYVQSITADGLVSPEAQYPFLVGTAPLVVSAQYPDNTWSGGANVAGTFEFSGGTAGIVSYDYSLDYGSTTTVAADAEGRASMTFTPAADYETHTLVVTGHTADGGMTDSTTYYIYVATV